MRLLKTLPQETQSMLLEDALGALALAVTLVVGLHLPLLF